VITRLDGDRCLRQQRDGGAGVTVRDTTAPVFVAASVPADVTMNATRCRPGQSERDGQLRFNR